MPAVIDKPIVVLSEGEADRKFVERLVATRMGEDRCCFPFPNNRFHSASMFDKMLSAVKGDGVAYSELRGVIIIADACNDPGATFASIIAAVSPVGGFVLPEELGVVPTKASLPRLCVHTLPASTRSGGLETLFNDDLALRHPEVYKEAQRFIAKSPAGTGGWNAEKQGKALFATLVAATHQDDPGRAASFAFRDPPTVDLFSAAFAEIEVRLKGSINDLLAA